MSDNRCQQIDFALRDQFTGPKFNIIDFKYAHTTLVRVARLQNLDSCKIPCLNFAVFGEDERTLLLACKSHSKNKRRKERVEKANVCRV